ncbi:MAG: hypothetical protein EOM14_15885, partial [Clostridia bacterium]|nr:hypothetical protein [Clostridia bacterium]
MYCCIRLYPHEVRGEGHFAALLLKAAARPQEAQPVSLLPADRVFSPADRQTLDTFQTLWQELTAEAPPDALSMIGSL